jgi:hypothetical protein
MDDEKAMLYMQNRLEILRMEVKELRGRIGVREVEMREIHSAIDES